MPVTSIQFSTFLISRARVGIRLGTAALLLLACSEQPLGELVPTSPSAPASSGGSSAAVTEASGGSSSSEQPFVPVASPDEHCYFRFADQASGGEVSLFPIEPGTAWPATETWDEPYFSGWGGGHSEELLPQGGQGGAAAGGVCSPYINSTCDDGYLTRHEELGETRSICCYTLKYNGVLDCRGQTQCRPLGAACDDDRPCCSGSHGLNVCGSSGCFFLNPR